MESKKRQAKEERSTMSKAQRMAFTSEFKAADRAAMRDRTPR
ncbi:MULTISPECIES: YfhE family protein [Alteribacter]|uniref:YfhE family protein n=1 Tax=Alteribacter keqinensis TaxID=2483800 RepID=A0A3M7TPG1_9BACI|nr:MULTISPECIES: YfhE family protein [Alteribacter]MBM7097732.1 YfhE family protein [Alteribacter salitolerans]RNA67134.1 YfhE family protein [Alteribacter keqinensis]